MRYQITPILILGEVVESEYFKNSKAKVYYIDDDHEDIEIDLNDNDITLDRAFVKFDDGSQFEFYSEELTKVRDLKVIQFIGWEWGLGKSSSEGTLKDVQNEHGEGKCYTGFLGYRAQYFVVDECTITVADIHDMGLLLSVYFPPISPMTQGHYKELLEEAVEE